MRRTTSARLSFLFAGLLIASFVTVGALTWVVSRSAAERELRNRITLEVQALRTEAGTEGTAGTIGAIDARAEQVGSLEYMLLDARGELLAGESTLGVTGEGWTRVKEVEPDGVVEDLLVYTQTFDDGLRLSVGGDLGRMERTRDRIVSALFGIGGATATVVLVVGWLATRRTLGRMQQFNSALARVEAGDLDARVPVRSVRSPDDIDRLANGINTVLGRIAHLVGSVRRVSTEIAHELRTPLSHLQQKLERARATGHCQERWAELDAAQQEVHEILRTFDAMLRLAEIESGTARSRFSTLDLAALVDRVSDAYRPDFEVSGRHLILGPMHRVDIWGDADLLTQGLSNLLENAMVHTPAGATIVIEVSRYGERACLSVRDNGPGVSASDRERIVAPFVRVGTARSGSGSGLGLSIVAAVAALHICPSWVDANALRQTAAIALPLPHEGGAEAQGRSSTPRGAPGIRHPRYASRAGLRRHHLPRGADLRHARCHR